MNHPIYLFLFMHTLIGHGHTVIPRPAHFWKTFCFKPMCPPLIQLSSKFEFKCINCPLVRISQTLSETDIISLKSDMNSDENQSWVAKSEVTVERECERTHVVEMVKSSAIWRKILPVPNYYPHSTIPSLNIIQTYYGNFRTAG